MALESFARHSLAQFVKIYDEIYTGEAIPPAELDALMWGRLCAKEAGITKSGFKIPFENIKRAKVTLPYMPDYIIYNGCPVIKKSGGLYTPCCTKLSEGAVHCKTCSVDKEGNVKPLPLGTVETRAENIELKTFEPDSFGDWMKGHKTTLTEVYAKLAAAGIQIEVPAAELVCSEPKRNRKGRPSKPEASDEDSLSSKSDEDSVPPKALPEPDVSAAGIQIEVPAAELVCSEPKRNRKGRPSKPEASDEDSLSSDISDESDEEPKAAKEPNEPKEPKEPKAPKAPKAPKEPKAPKAPKEPKAPKADKEPKEPKAPKEPKEPKAPKEPKEPKEPKAPKADKEPKAPKADKVAMAAAAEELGRLEEFEEECEECEVDDKTYTLRKGIIIRKEDGMILGSLDEDGDVVWTSEER